MMVGPGTKDSLLGKNAVVAIYHDDDDGDDGITTL